MKSLDQNDFLVPVSHYGCVDGYDDHYTDNGKDGDWTMACRSQACPSNDKREDQHKQTENAQHSNAEGVVTWSLVLFC